jgi:outer membrane biosynthesis protein TonB
VKLERAQIAPVVASIKAKALDCRSTEGEGLVKIAVDVHSDGTVSHAMVLESPESSVGECVARVVRSAQFPVTDQGGSFVYRLDLAAQ